VATRCCKKFEDMITRFDTIHERDGQTDGRTNKQTPHVHSIARQKKQPFVFSHNYWHLSQYSWGNDDSMRLKKRVCLVNLLCKEQCKDAVIKSIWGYVLWRSWWGERIKFTIVMNNFLVDILGPVIFYVTRYPLNSNVLNYSFCLLYFPFYHVVVNKLV